MKGPGIFLAQFAGDEAPYNSLASMAERVAGMGYKAVQIPSWDGRLFDLKKAAESQDYCDEVAAFAARPGWRSASFRPICRASWSRSTRHMTNCFMWVYTTCPTRTRIGGVGYAGRRNPKT